jgi:hydrogenase maturation factor
MKTTTAFSLLAAAGLALSSAALAAGKDYQVTGPILEVNDSMIAVQKGKDRWEIARDANTKASGEMKVGDKVTVHYTMTATNIEAKAAKAEKGAKKEASPAASTKK